MVRHFFNTIFIALYEFTYYFRLFPILATQRRTRVKIKDSLLARVQGRLRARSTTSAPSLIDRTPSALTLTEGAPSALILTERPPSDPVTTIAPSTETVTDSSTSTVKDENLFQTTFKLPPPSTEILFERSTDPPSTVEEDVFTETSVSMSIGQSEGKLCYLIIF